MPTKEFPLTVWELTEEAAEEYKKAQKRFDEIRERLRKKGCDWTALNTLRFDNNSNPEAWLNDNMPLMASERCKNSDDAVAYALKHGDCGWWSLDELAEFAQSRGPIFEQAMWDLGYRRSIRNPEKWAKVTKEDREHGNPASHKRWHEKHDIVYTDVPKTEVERLASMFVLPNESAGLNRTYSIDVNKRGMIYVELDVNPFSAVSAEQLGMLGAMYRNRGHLAKQQSGFEIDAKNVKLGEQKGVYIRAVRKNSSVAECVWPVQIPQVKLQTLADDLVSRVNGTLVRS